MMKILIPSLNCPLNTGSTASLIVETRTSDNYLIDIINNGLGLTSGSLTPSDFKLVTVTASNSKTGGSAQYRFSIIPSITHYVTNVLTIQFPSSYVLPPILQCQLRSPSLLTAVQCSPDNQNKISYTLPMKVDTTTGLEIGISLVTNPIEAMIITGFSVLTATSTGAFIHSKSSGISYTTSASLLSPGNLTRGIALLSQMTSYTFTFYPINTYPSNVTIELSVPSQVNIPNGFVCKAVSGFTQNPSTCRIKPTTTNVIQMSGGGPYLNSIMSFSIQNLQNPTSNVNSDPFSITVYSQNGNIIEQLPSSPSNGLIAITPCDSSCGSCLVNDRYACTGCNDGLKLYQSGYICVVNCPTWTYDDFGTCINCDSTCLRCNSTGSSSCTACNQTSLRPYLFNGQCKTQCPIGFYPDSLKTCQSCPTECTSCNGPQACTGCQSPLYLYNGQCIAQCPNGYFNDPSGNCIKCKTGCLTCNSLSNCTSCDS